MTNSPVNVQSVLHTYIFETHNVDVDVLASPKTRKQVVSCYHEIYILLTKARCLSEIT